MSNSLRFNHKNVRFYASGFARKFLLGKLTLITSIMMLSSIGVYAQKEKLSPPDMPRDEKNSQIYYMDVVKEDGVEKTEFFKRAGNWYHKFYKNPGGIVEQTDSVNGKLVLKPAFPVYRMKNTVKMQAAIIKYTLELGLKDGRYRYEIKNINIQASSYSPIEKLFSANDPNIEDNYHTLDEVNKYFKDLIEDLKAGMRQPSNLVKKDEW